MKKQILSTSAIALGVAMAAPASAQEWDLDWGGFANTHVGISSIDRNFASPDRFDGVNIFTNSEIIFSPNVTLDNGMTFGFNVQMEALNGGGADGIDESYVTISSDTLGRIDLGSENSAGYRSMVAAALRSAPCRSTRVRPRPSFRSPGRAASVRRLCRPTLKSRQQRRSAHHLFHAVLQRPDPRCVLRAQQRW